MDPSILTWLLRIQETEALLEARHNELQSQLDCRLDQEAIAQENFETEEKAREELSALDAQTSASCHRLIRAQKALVLAKTKYQQQKLTATLLSRKRELQSKQNYLKAACATETRQATRVRYVFDSWRSGVIEGNNEPNERRGKMQAALDACLARNSKPRLQSSANPIPTHIEHCKEKVQMYKLVLQAAREQLASFSSEGQRIRQLHNARMVHQEEQLQRHRSLVYSAQSTQAARELRLKNLQMEADDLRQRQKQLAQKTSSVKQSIYHLTGKTPNKVAPEPGCK